ncbi:MAG: DsrE family protein [Gammaproteobacteria bacterium]|nr:DsrE family protein [Gammaproteobacteria bacterium]
MTRDSVTLTRLLLAALLTVALALPALADGKPHKLVIQVSTDDPQTQAIAMNNAVNLQKDLGMDNVEIEIVAYGPGLGMLTRQSELSGRVQSLALQDITFSACNNTMKGIEKRTGRMPELTEGVQVVPAGVTRIMELQEQGYAYVRP